MGDLRTDITDALNKASVKNEIDTPDFKLAVYLNDCLIAWDNPDIAIHFTTEDSPPAHPAVEPASRYD